MFGFIHESIRQMMIRMFGDEFWKEAMHKVGFDTGKENIVNHHYPDTDTYAIVDSVSALAKIPRDEIWEMYGAFLIEYTMEIGWDQLIRTISPNLKGFLDNLDSLHYFIDHVVYKANLRGPSFRCEENPDSSITLHYFTSRSGLYPIVKGVIREVARRVFNMEIQMSMTGRTQRTVQMAAGERVEEHVIFLIKMNSQSGEEPCPLKQLYSPTAPLPSIITNEAAEVFIPFTPPLASAASNVSAASTSSIDGNPYADWELRISKTDFAALLPYHIVVDRDCRLVQFGKALLNHVSADLLQIGTPLLRIFEIYRPQIPLDFESICNFINAIFVLQVRTSPLALSQRTMDQQIGGGGTGDEDAQQKTMQAQHLKLKGQMMLLSSGDELMYLCSPYVTSIPELLKYGLRMSAIPLHDVTRDLILLNQQRLSDVEANLQLEANNEQLEQMARDLEAEKTKTDNLLRQMLPASVATTLLSGSTVDAREYPEATVMFCDVPAFQSIVPFCQPKGIVRLLNDLFTAFDRLVTLHNVYKVETVGDSYMTVGGVPDSAGDHCERVCHVALAMVGWVVGWAKGQFSHGTIVYHHFMCLQVWEARSVPDPIAKCGLRVRCGIHSGNIVAGVVGVKMPRFCLFGDTVNTAARMESHSPPGMVHCSDTVCRLAQRTGRFEFVCRGNVSIKGKGTMRTHFLMRSYKKSVWELVGQPRDENVNSIDGYEELAASMDLRAAMRGEHHHGGIFGGQQQEREQRDGQKTKACQLM